MTNEEYHRDTSRISKSGLDLIAKSPLHYYEAKLNPANILEDDDSEESKDLILGRAFHALCLEPHLFPELFVVAPEINRRSSAGKQLWNDFQSMNAGKTVLTQRQYDTVQRMKDAAFKHPVVFALMQSGRAETTITWTDPTTGVACKCRPDWLTNNRYVLDFKSAKDASPRGFAKAAFEHRYHVQHPYYMDGLHAAGMRQYDTFLFVAVEKKPPFAVAIYALPPEAVQLGRETYIEDLKIYAGCLKSNQWPGYPTEIRPLILPSYAYNQL